MLQLQEVLTRSEMQAIEFETRIEGQSITIPPELGLLTGSTVKVVLLFEPKAHHPKSGITEGPILRLMQNPRVVKELSPLSREAAHDR